MGNTSTRMIMESIGGLHGLVDRAKAIAQLAHHGQVDKGGSPYIDHPAQVARTLELHGYGDAVIAVGWLHDTVEDSDLTLEDMRRAFPGRDDIVDAVGALTKVPGQTLEEYFDRVRANPIAVSVKFADIAHNTREDRLALLDEATRERLRAKYAKSVQLLTGMSLTDASQYLNARAGAPETTTTSDIDRIHDVVAPVLAQTCEGRKLTPVELSALVLDAVKPVVRTPGELAGLPPGAVVRDDDGRVLVLVDGGGMWARSGHEALVASDQVVLPAYVLDFGV